MQADTPRLMFERIESGRLGETATRAALRPQVNFANASQLVAELLSPADIAGIEADWRMLEARTLEPNPFHASDFILAACQHFREGAAPQFIGVWEPAHNPGQRRLVGLLPFQKPHQTWAGALLHGWTHPFVAFSAPLVDCTNSDAILAAAIDHLNRHYPHMTALSLCGIAANGPIAVALARVVAARGTNLTTLSTYQRGALTPGALKSASSPSRAKKLRQKHRWLSEIGTPVISVAATYSDVRAAAEDFLALESKGWKGARGSALVQDPDTSNFVRTMLWSAARRDRVRIASLSINGQTIASVIMLTAGDRGFLWKIAYDEDYAKFSPGVVLIDAFSRQILAEKSLASVDSCTQPGNEMIEGLWADRITLCDVMIGLDTGKSPAFLATLAREKFRRSLRQRVKQVYRTLRGHA